MAKRKLAPFEQKEAAASETNRKETTNAEGLIINGNAPVSNKATTAPEYDVAGNEIISVNVTMSSGHNSTSKSTKVPKSTKAPKATKKSTKAPKGVQKEAQAPAKKLPRRIHRLYLLQTIINSQTVNTRQII
jgi:cell division septation protein DedD